jgi:hypothetical protein
MGIFGTTSGRSQLHEQPPPRERIAQGASPAPAEGYSNGSLRSGGNPPGHVAVQVTDGASSYRLFEPPSSFVLIAIAHNKLVVCVSALALCLAGLGYGLSRSETFTSSATLQVGQVNPNSPGFYSYVASASALAGAFSRAITAEPVLAALRRKLGVSPVQAVSRLSAEPIPQSPVFRVIATGPSASSSIGLANAAASAVVAYESEANNANPQAATLLHEYDAASLALERAKARQAEHEAAARARGRRAVSQRDFASDRAAKDTAQARLKALASAYTAAVTSQAPRTGLVSLLAGAPSASGDRKAKAELFGFVGLLAGILVGCVVAVVRERRRGGQRLGGSDVERQEPLPAR